ncbi:MAG TPA: hypothetical protein DDY04_01520 [Bacteroidales bacterium]|nr:hypothetical protein [Bacteroidales bacterium]
MRKAVVFILFIAFGVSAFAQSEHKLVRKGNRAYSKNDFLESEVQYRQALEKNKYSFKANFNLANALYKQNKFNEADSTYSDINASGLTDGEKSMVYYNMGNTLFKQNKFKESADAYTMALKHNPDDMDAKYNLSEALRMIQNQQNQKNQQQDNNGENDGNDNKDQNEQGKENEQNNQNEREDNQNNDQNNQNKNDQQQPKISKEDAERMLQALQQREKEIQDKLAKKQAKPVSGASIKNW